MLTGVRLRAGLHTAAPAGVVLLGAVLAAQVDWRVAGGAWAAVFLLSLAAVSARVRDAGRLIRWIRAMRDGKSGRPPEISDSSLRELARSLGQLESEVGRVRSAAARRDQFLDGLLGALPMPVLCLAPGGRVTHANAAATALFGKGPVGCTLPELTRVPAFLDLFEAAARGGPVQTVQCRLPAQDGGLFQVSVHPFDDRPERRPRQVMVGVELAGSAPVEETRTTFLANAGHELRTPLTAILGMVETLQGAGRDDPELQARYLDRLGRQATRMVKLFDDMINLSAVEMSERLPPEGRVELVSLAREAVEDLAGPAAQRGSRIRLDGPGDPVAVTGDREQLRQLVTNLLSNAIKHGPEGGAVRIAIAADPPRITVTDAGEGIPPGETERVFERFYRSAHARNQRIAGHGLGLAIVKHVARRHGAVLGVQSGPGAGCAISVTFRGPAPPVGIGVT